MLIVLSDSHYDIVVLIVVVPWVWNCTGRVYVYGGTYHTYSNVLRERCALLRTVPQEYTSNWPLGELNLEGFGLHTHATGGSSRALDAAPSCSALVD